MAFKHKLSCRLALLRDAVLLLASVAAFSSCEVPAAGPTDLTRQVVQVVVVPDSISLDPSQHMKFSAYGRTTSGDSSAVTVTWQATGGSIASDGMFAADTAAGDFAVTGTSSGLKLSASSRVRIRPRPVASMAVTPGAASGVVGQTFQLAAIPRDASGNVLSGRFVTWVSSNTAVATVSGGGAVTTVAVGSATITATSEGKSGTAAVTVTQASVPVASVTVSPASASITVGQTAPLTATPRDASGNALAGRVVTWGSGSPAAATVNGSGLVTGVGAGSATITASSEGKSGTAAITVVSAPAPSADTIFAEGFESGNLSKWQDGVDPSRHRVMTDPSLAHSGGKYLEITYPTNGDGGYLARFFMPGYDSVYMSYYIRFDPSWTGMTKLMSLYGSRIDDQWSAFGRAGNCPNGTDFFNAFLTTEPGTGDPGNVRFYSYYPDMAREADGVTCWGRYGDGSTSYFTPLSLTRGVWHRIELWVKANTPGQYNATQKLWIDGVLRGTWSGFRFRNTTDLRLNAFVIIALSAPASVTRKIQIDDIVILPAAPSP